MRAQSATIHQRTLAAVPLALALAICLSPAVAIAAQFTDSFRVQDCTWKSRSSQNPYFPLRPGSVSVLEGAEDGAFVRVEISVLRETERLRFETAGGKTINVRARVVEEREFEDGELVEISRNFLALCRQTSDIYYFGEDVEDYEDGEVVGSGGQWRVGVDGARPGILFPGTFLLGARYFQEVAPGVALDRTRNVATDLEVETPVGTFGGCVGVLDSNALDPAAGAAPKVYCPGVGLALDDFFSLVEFEP